MKEMSGQEAGPLLIGASMTIGEYVLPQLIGKFKARFPAVVPTLFVGNSEAVQERVAERTLDLGFIEGDSHLPSLASEVCCEDELQVVCAPSHPLGEGAVRAAAHADRACLHQPRAGLGHARGHRPLPAQAGVSPESMNVVVELGSPEALKGLVATGLGFAIMSRVIVAKELRLGQLVQIPLAPRADPQFLGGVSEGEDPLAAGGGFLAFAKERLAAVQRLAA